MAGLLDTGKQPAIGGLLGLTPPQKAGLFDYALAAFAGGGLSGAAALGLQQRRDQRNYAGQTQRLEQLGQQAEAAGLSPQERFALSLDPKSALDMLGKRYEPQQVTGGNTLVRGNEKFFAPKATENDGIYGTQTENGWTQTGARGPSIAENQTAKRDQNSYVAALTPEGMLPKLDPAGQVTGASLIPEYGRFALQKAATGATRVTVPVTLPAQNAFADQLAKNYANKLDVAQGEADTARSSISVLDEAQSLLNDGVITGLGADMRLKAARAQALAGDGRAARAVKNTETFEAVMGKQVLNVAKQLGTASGITNSDREFAGKVAGGSIALNEGTIRRLNDIQRKQAATAIQRAQSMGDEAFQGVPSAQGLPQSTFGGGARGAGPQAARGGQPSQPRVINYDAQGRRVP